MLPDDSMYKAGEYTLFGTGLISIIFFALRKIVRTVSSDSVATTQDKTQRNTLDSLHSEITRLEVTIRSMQSEVSALKKQQDKLRNKLIKAQIALIDVEFSLTVCTCENVLHIRDSLAGVRRTLLESEKDDDDGTQKSDQA